MGFTQHLMGERYSTHENFSPEEFKKLVRVAAKLLIAWSAYEPLHAVAISELTTARVGQRLQCADEEGLVKAFLEDDAICVQFKMGFDSVSIPRLERAPQGKKYFSTHCQTLRSPCYDTFVVALFIAAESITEGRIQFVSDGNPTDKAAGIDFLNETMKENRYAH